MKHLALTLTLALGLVACAEGAPGPRSDKPAAEPVSGYAFLTEETKALQDDDFANPGYLWVYQGRALFKSEAGVSQSCQSCHEGAVLEGAATKYPSIDEASGKLINLETRINACRTRHQGAEALAYESEALLSLTAFVANQSKGMTSKVKVGPRTRVNYEAGKAYYFRRKGQFNFSCSQCHDENWGKRLRGDTISQGHSNGFPAYRLEWEKLGSLHRRLKDCDTGIRAEPMLLGSQTYTDLELYLTIRAQSLPLESPAVRR